MFLACLSKALYLLYLVPGEQDCIDSCRFTGRDVYSVN